MTEMLHESSIVGIWPSEILQIIHSKFQVLQMRLRRDPSDPFREVVHMVAEGDVLVVYDKLLESGNVMDRGWLFHLLNVVKYKDR